jgi:hypothetical protein
VSDQVDSINQERSDDRDMGEDPGVSPIDDRHQSGIDGSAPWELYSREGTPTHLARPGTDLTYCDEALATLRPQGTVDDPAGFGARDQLCTDCLRVYLGTVAAPRIPGQDSDEGGSED